MLKGESSRCRRAGEVVPASWAVPAPGAGHSIAPCTQHTQTLMLFWISVATLARISTPPPYIQAPLLQLCSLGEVQAKRRNKKGVRSAKTSNFSWLKHAKTHRVFPPLFWKVCYVHQAVPAQHCCTGQCWEHHWGHRWPYWECLWAMLSSAGSIAGQCCEHH